MAYIDDLNAELARLQKLPPNSSTQSIQRVQQQIAAEQKRLAAIPESVEDINTNLGSKNSLPATNDVGNFSLLQLAKRELQQGADLNDTVSTAAFQQTANSYLASIYGAVSSADRYARSIYGFIQRPSFMMMASELSAANMAGLVSNVNNYLFSSIYGFYSLETLIDPTGPTYRAVITEQNPFV